MKIGRIFQFGALAGAGSLIYRVYKKYQADKDFDLTMPPISNNGTMPTALNSSNRSVSPELLEILACPLDKQPVELLTDDHGKEWLLNPRNGYRYPIEDGIPVMLIEEGEKYQDSSLIRSN